MITDLLLKLGELRGRIATRNELYGHSQGGWDDALQRIDEIIDEVKNEMNKQRGGSGNE